MVWFLAHSDITSYKIEVMPLEKLSYDIFSKDYYKGLIIVELDRNNSIYLNSSKVTSQQLKSKVSNYCKNRPKQQRVAYVKASKVLPYKLVYSLIDDLKGEGVIFIKLQLDYFDVET